MLTGQAEMLKMTFVTSRSNFYDACKSVDEVKWFQGMTNSILESDCNILCQRFFHMH